MLSAERLGFLLRRPGRVVLIAFLSCIPAVYFTVLLFGDLRADIRALLPSNAPSVLTLNEMEKRFGGWAQLSIVVESPDREANRRFSNDLVEALKKLPMVRTARNRLGEERDFLEKRWLLFLTPEELDTVAERIEDAANESRRRANPLLVDLEQTGKPEPIRLDFSDLEQKYKSKIDLSARFPDAYFESPDQHTLAINVLRRGVAFALDDNQALIDNIDRLVAQLDPKKYNSEMVVGYGGDVKNVLEEQASLVEDLVTATLMVIVLIAVVLVLYYRRFRALYLLGFPVLVATLWTFAIAHFTIGYLTASSSFLAAIIPGNGINFGLIFFARYVEERRRLKSVDESLDLAIRHTWQGTGTAAAAAAIAYGSLIVTDFLGFKHFGIIGGIGMMLSWISTFVVLPAIVLFVEKKWPLDADKEIKVLFFQPGSLTSLPAKLTARAPVLFAVVGVLTGIAGAVGTAMYLRDPFEKDFRKLQSTSAVEHGSAYWEAKSDKIFSRHMNPQVILVDRTEDIPEILKKLQAVIDQGGDHPLLSEVAALNTFVPEDQDKKLPVLDRIRKLLSDDLLANLDEDQRKLALRYRPSEDLKGYTVADLPESLRRDFRELDGREGHVVLALPNLNQNLYDADVIQKIADVLRTIKLEDGRIVRSSGNYVIYADMLEAVRRDGPRATGYSFFAVLILCAIVFHKPRRVLQVAGILLLGVCWLGGIMALRDIRINFLNFIALPITFGIGADYAVNVFARNLIERSTKDRVSAAKQAVMATGGAVALCSATTIIGYGSLLVAHSGALVSFGKVAILGELTCLTAALIFLPAWMMLIRDQNDPK